MYWPYLRSKENEILAVRELTTLLASNQLVVPIYKPTTANDITRRRLDGIASGGVRFAWIVNSDDGKPPPTQTASEALLDFILGQHPTMAFPAIEIRPRTLPTDIRSFARKYAKHQCVIVHRDHLLSAAAITAALAALGQAPIHVFIHGGTSTAVQVALSAGNTILIRDGFSRQPTNGAYPPRTNFDDLLFTYGSHGHQGFGDFGPLGDIFISGGATPSHVALHLTEATAGQAIVCHHFVSSVSTTVDVATKYLDAVRQLCGCTGAPPGGAFGTAGVANFHNSYRTAHYPGLGLPKRWSLKHHIELVQSHLVQVGSRAFV
jgi:hypothetical protein